jgi:hypothetical protein
MPDGLNVAKRAKAAMMSTPTLQPDRAKWMDAATLDLLVSLTDKIQSGA